MVRLWVAEKVSYLVEYWVGLRVGRKAAYLVWNLAVLLVDWLVVKRDDQWVDSMV